VLTFDALESLELQNAHRVLAERIILTSLKSAKPNHVAQPVALYLDWLMCSSFGQSLLWNEDDQLPRLRASGPKPVENIPMKNAVVNALRRHYSNCNIIKGATKLQFGGVYFDYIVQRVGAPIAFILLDDEASYRLEGTLRRAAQLMDGLHRAIYPDVFVYRMQRAEVRRLGEATAAGMLVDAITEDMAVLNGVQV
jgi:hypothetical protein